MLGGWVDGLDDDSFISSHTSFHRPGGGDAKIGISGRGLSACSVILLASSRAFTP